MGQFLLFSMLLELFDEHPNATGICCLIILVLIISLLIIFGK